MIKKLIVVLSLLLCIVIICNADYWEPPTCKRYYSNDSTSSIYMTPACISIVKKRKNKKIDTCTGTCPYERPCMAIVNNDKGGVVSTQYSFELVNLYAPTDVFISNNGKYVITIDDWGTRGYGENTMVIYKNGELIKKYSLAEMSPLPLDDYKKTISSIHWFYGLEFINDSSILITFQDKNKRNAKKRFDLPSVN